MIMVSVMIYMWCELIASVYKLFKLFLVTVYKSSTVFLATFKSQVSIMVIMLRFAGMIKMYFAIYGYIFYVDHGVYVY